MEPVDDTVDHVRRETQGRPIVQHGDYACPYSRGAFLEIERVESQLGDRVPTGEIPGTPTLFIDGVMHRGPHDAATLLQEVTHP
jgi:hypothetical protein